MFELRELVTAWRSLNATIPAFTKAPFPLDNNRNWVTRKVYQEKILLHIDHRSNGGIRYSAEFLYKYHNTRAYDIAWLALIIKHHVLSPSGMFIPTKDDFFLSPLYYTLMDLLKVEVDPWSQRASTLMPSSALKIGHPRPRSALAWAHLAKLEADHHLMKSNLIHD